MPSRGMEAIARQLAEGLPEAKIRTGAKVASVAEREVVLTTGQRVKGRAVVLATEGPETARLLGSIEPRPSRGELCLYYSAKTPPITEPYLILNGDGKGWVNSVTVPSVIAPSYSPDGRELISVVVIGRLSARRRNRGKKGASGVGRLVRAGSRRLAPSENNPHRSCPARTTTPDAGPDNESHLRETRDLYLR